MSFYCVWQRLHGGAILCGRHMRLIVLFIIVLFMVINTGVRKQPLQGKRGAAWKPPKARIRQYAGY